MAVRESPPTGSQEGLGTAFEGNRGRTFTAVFPESAGLFEAFRVWLLDAQAVREQTDATLADLAQETDEWHYQVYPMDSEARASEGPTGHLRCAPADGATEALAPMASVPESLLAEKLRATLPAIEEGYPGASALVRLLEVPEFSLFALWLSQGPDEAEPFDSVLVVHAPDLFSDLDEATAVDEALEPGDFLDAIRRQEPVRGFILQESPPTTGDE